MDPISLTTICNGAAEEVFRREFAELLKNITDPNTDPEAKRRITLVFDFKPMGDRSGAEVKFACAARLAPVSLVKSSIFLARKDGDLQAYSTDSHQTALFEQKPEAAAPSEKGRSVRAV